MRKYINAIADSLNNSTIFISGEIENKLVTPEYIINTRNIMEGVLYDLNLCLENKAEIPRIIKGPANTLGKIEQKRNDCPYKVVHCYHR